MLKENWLFFPLRLEKYFAKDIIEGKYIGCLKDNFEKNSEFSYTKICVRGLFNVQIWPSFPKK